MSNSNVDTVIIGAGMAGLVAARLLQDAGRRVTVLEKSRGIGGRLATRQVRDDGPAKGLLFDHGAPNLQVSDTIAGAAFAATLEELARKGSAQLAPDGDWIGTPRMNALLAPLAKEIDIRFQTRAQAITRTKSGIQITCTMPDEKELTLSGQTVLCAAPAPQTMDLLSQAAPEIASAAGTAEMRPCWTLMLAVHENANFDEMPTESNGRIFEKVIAEHSKPERAPSPMRIVAHAGEDWSRVNLEVSKEQALEAMMSEALSKFGFNQEDILYAAAHRWRFSQTKTPVGELFLSNRQGDILAAGDWLLGPNGEDAFTSGRAAAVEILSRTGS